MRIPEIGSGVRNIFTLPLQNLDRYQVKEATTEAGIPISEKERFQWLLQEEGAEYSNSIACVAFTVVAPTYK